MMSDYQPEGAKRRGPGRPRKNPLPEPQAEPDVALEAAEEPELKRPAEERARRRRRGALGMAGNLKLTLPEGVKDPNYEYRWFKSLSDRIRKMNEFDDWDFVGKPHDDDNPHDRSMGENYERPGGVDKDGKPFNLVLMRKRKDWYEADKAEEQSVNDATDEAIRRGSSASPQGLTDNPDTAPTSYIPEGGIQIRSGSKA